MGALSYSLRESTGKRIKEHAARYGSGLAPTVRLCIGAVLPDTPHAELTPADLPQESPPELDQLVDTTSLDP